METNTAEKPFNASCFMLDSLNLTEKDSMVTRIFANKDGKCCLLGKLGRLSRAVLLRRTCYLKLAVVQQLVKA